MNKKLVFGCCFCGKSIDDDEGIGLAMVDRETGEFVQQFWCHENCFLERLVRIARESYYKPEGGDYEAR